MNGARQYPLCENPLFRLWLALSVCLTTGSAAAQTAFLGIDHIREGWESTYGSLGSMKVVYCERLVTFKPPPDDPNALVPVRVMHVERLEQHERYHLKTSMAEEGFSRREDTLWHAFDGEASTGYVGAHNIGHVKRGMTTHSYPVTNSLKRHLLLDPMRFRNRDEDVSVFRHYVGSSIAKVLPELEPVAGVPCHVVEIRRDGDKAGVKIWVAHDRGFLPLKFERISGDSVNGYTLEQRVVQEIAMAEAETGTFWYPTKARRFLRQRSGEEGVNEINVSEFVPNAPVTKDAFRVAFPPGAQVYDQIAGASYRVGESLGGAVAELPVIAVGETDVNQPADVTATVKTENAGAAVLADQQGREGVPAPRALAAKAPAGGGLRRMLPVALAGLGVVVLLTGIWLLRVNKCGMAQNGR